MEYIIKRSRRKSIAIHITKDAAVEVHAPMRISKSILDELVASKEEWIQKHLLKMEEKKQKREEFTLNEKDKLFILGKEYPIIIADSKKASFDGISIYLPFGDLPVHKDAMVELYKCIAHDIIPKRVDIYAKLMDVTPKNIKITSAKTRWGSCSGDNRLNFSWHLVMAPLSVVDYVVIHELSHITEHNHSARFWAIVEKFCPKFQKEKQSLKALSQRLQEENW